MSFQHFVLHPKILKSIEEMGFTTPTPIQKQAIPKILEGIDIRASAQTGTGKTAAFLLPALCRLINPSPAKARGPRILVLVPTRELAMQVATEAQKYSKHIPHVKTVCVYGGTPYPQQNRDLSSPYEILVATPGRLIDHMDRGRINFSRLEMLILDEADRMLDMGFIKPVEKIAAATPSSRQTLMFSATLKGAVFNLSKRLLKNSIEINIAVDLSQNQLMDQQLYHVDNVDHKYLLLEHFFKDAALSQAIVFTATKHQADKLSYKLSENGFPAAPLHGDMNQNQRTRTMANLRRGKIRILVATDVASRGLDVLTISHVINFDLPQSPEDYVHRIGRTARAGATGIALSFAAYKDFPMVRDIERFTDSKIPVHTVPGLEPKIKHNSSQPKKIFNQNFRRKRWR